MRTISAEFMADLKNEDGILHPILERVKQDDTLMLAIREDYINIYYRGGNILRVEEKEKHSYVGSFDDEYRHPHKPITEIETTAKRKKVAAKWSIKLLDDAQDRAESFSQYKEIMDVYFSKKHKAEREFQQLVARENNYSTISNETEYFVTDIEVTESDIGARYDMLAVRWLASHRKNGSKCCPVLIEMKYGDDALSNDAGLLDHLKDMDAIVTNTKKFSDLLNTIETQFNQLTELSLLKYRKAKKETAVKLGANRPEVLFILANHNPRSPKLPEILSNAEIDAYGSSPNFDLRFAVSSFSGYGLHVGTMYNLDEFRQLLQQQYVRSRQKR